MTEQRRGRDRRKDRRYHSGGRVRIWQAESGVYLAGSIIDLSMGGCLVHVPATGALELHSIIEASFQSNYLAFRSMGSVRRVDAKNSLIGIHYLNLSLRGRLDLMELFADLDALIAQGSWNASGPRRPSPFEAAEKRRRAAETGPFLLPP